MDMSVSIQKSINFIWSSRWHYETFTQLAVTHSKLTTETLVQGVKHVQS